LRRGPSGWTEDEPIPAAESKPGALSTEIVTAPILGVLYRRSAPDQPLLVESGARVEAGQPICLIEVMKSYHEVTAPRAGTLVEFLVADGDYVEYGQAIARIAD
jgi:acetyl-CoA carboxylase biotin carboxyl carrier protein